MSVRSVRIRCCSFCKAPGHTISICNSTALQDFENRIINVIENADNPNDIRDRVRTHLLDEPVVILRAFARSRINVPIKTDILTVVLKILEYFNERITDRENIIRHQAIFDREIGLLMQMYNFDNTSRLETMLFWELLTLFVQNIGEEKSKLNVKMIKKQVTPDEPCECNICYEVSSSLNFIELNCGHSFCRGCVKKSLQHDIKTCGLCRSNIDELIVVNEEDLKQELSGLVEFI